MGEIAEDMIDGTCCILCGCYFQMDGHLYAPEYSAVCWDCWDDLTDEEKKDYTKAVTHTF